MAIQQESPYATMTAAIEQLRQEGYVHDFNQHNSHLECKQLEKKFQPENFTITHVYRWEGMSSAGDNSVLYTVEADDGTKGIIVDAYGADADALSLEMIEKFRVEYAKPGEL
jgi:hypothetical protein